MTYYNPQSELMATDPDFYMVLAAMERAGFDRAAEKLHERWPAYGPGKINTLRRAWDFYVRGETKPAAINLAA